MSIQHTVYNIFVVPALGKYRTLIFLRPNRRQKWGAPFHPEWFFNDSSMELRHPVINSLVHTGAQGRCSPSTRAQVSLLGGVVSLCCSDVISAASILIDLVAIPTMQTGRFLVQPAAHCLTKRSSISDSRHCYNKLSVTQHNFSHTL